MEEKQDADVDDVDRESLVKEIELIRKTLGGASNRAPSDGGFVTESLDDRSTGKDSDDDSEDELAIIKSPEYRPSTDETFGTQHLSPAQVISSESEDEIVETTLKSRTATPRTVPSDSDFSPDERISYKISAIVPLNNETDDVELFLRPITKKPSTIAENTQVSSLNKASPIPSRIDSRRDESISDEYTLTELEPVNNNDHVQSGSLGTLAGYDANNESSVFATVPGGTLPDNHEKEVLILSDDGEILLSDDEELSEQQRCLKLNRKYQAIIEAELRKIDRLILENRKQQFGLSQMSSSLSKAKAIELKTIAAYGNPYFKKSRKERPDDNEDTKLRKALGQPHPYEKPPKPWRKGEKILLSDAVQSEVLQSTLTPLLQRVETIIPKRQKTKENEKELEDLRKEIDRIKSLPLPTLVENFTENIDFEDIANKMLPHRTPQQCQLFWYNELHPHLNKETWTKEEDKCLLKLAEKNSDGGNWDEIASELKSNRSPAQCLQRYQKYLNKDFLKSKWTPEDDKKLVEAVKICGFGSWEKVSSLIDGRTGSQCMHRYVKSIDPAIKRGRWNEDEDDLVRKGVEKYGSNWSMFKNVLPHRTDAQVRERWQDVLNPELRRTGWTKEEDEILLKVVEEHSLGLKSWVGVAKHMPGRTDNRCRRRWFNIMKDDPRAKEHLNMQKIQKAKLVNNFSRRRTTAKPVIGPEDFDLSDLSDNENNASTSQAPGPVVDDDTAVATDQETANTRESSPPRSPEKMGTRKSPRNLNTSGAQKRKQTRRSKSPKSKSKSKNRNKKDAPVATTPTESSPSQTRKVGRPRKKPKLTAPSPTVVSQASALPNATPMSSYLTQFSVLLQAFHVDVSGVLNKVNSPGRPIVSQLNTSNSTVTTSATLPTSVTTIAQTPSQAAITSNGNVSSQILHCSSNSMPMTVPGNEVMPRGLQTDANKQVFTRVTENVTNNNIQTTTLQLHNTNNALVPASTVKRSGVCTEQVQRRTNGGTGQTVSNEDVLNATTIIATPAKNSSLVSQVQITNQVPTSVTEKTATEEDSVRPTPRIGQIVISDSDDGRHNGNNSKVTGNQNNVAGLKLSNAQVGKLTTDTARLSASHSDTLLDVRSRQGEDSYSNKSNVVRSTPGSHMEASPTVSSGNADSLSEAQSKSNDTTEENANGTGRQRNLGEGEGVLLSDKRHGLNCDIVVLPNSHQEQGGESVDVANGGRPSKRKQDEIRSTIQTKRRRKKSGGRGRMMDARLPTVQNNEETTADSIERVETSPPSRYPKRSNRGHQQVDGNTLVGETANKEIDDCISECVSADRDKSISPGSVPSTCVGNNPQLRIKRISSHNIVNTTHDARLPAIPLLPPSVASLNAFKKLLTLRKDLQAQASRLKDAHNNQATDQAASRLNQQNAQPSNQNTSRTIPVQNPIADRLLLVSNTKRASSEEFSNSLPYQQLSNRFKGLFMWPGFLSIVNPSLVKPSYDSSQKDETQKTSKSKKTKRKRKAR